MQSVVTLSHAQGRGIGPGMKEDDDKEVVRGEEVRSQVANVNLYPPPP